MRLIKYLLIFSHYEEDRPIPLLRGSLKIMVKKRLTRDSKGFLVDFIVFWPQSTHPDKWQASTI